MQRSSAERYVRASTAGNLRSRRLVDGGISDLDVLTAAAFAARQGPAQAAALTVYRLIADGRQRPTRADLEGPAWTAAIEWGVQRLAADQDGRNKPAPYKVRRALAAEAILWACWPHCRPCTGRGLSAEPGTAGRLTHICRACHGSGRRTLGSGMQERDSAAVNRLAAELQRALDAVAASIAAKLRQ